LERALFEVMVLLMWAWIWASGSYKDSLWNTSHTYCFNSYCWPKFQHTEALADLPRTTMDSDRFTGLAFMQGIKTALTTATHPSDFSVELHW